jgi:hypothetical protein
MKHHTAPIIAAILLLLPVLYVGSYLAMVMPKGVLIPMGTTRDGTRFFYLTEQHYRFAAPAACYVFWPLEQIDRKVRPGVWEDSVWE